MAAHQEAIGFTACNIIEVNPGNYSLFMGEVEEDETGLAKYMNGSLDSGNRIVLYIDLLFYPISSKDSNFYQAHAFPSHIIHELFQTYNAREVEHPSPRIMAIFTFSADALQCARTIKEEINRWSKTHKQYNFELKMGLGVGSPVTDGDTFFGDAIQTAKHLSQMAPPEQILISSLMKELSRDDPNLHSNLFNFISPRQESFLRKLMDFLESNLNDPEYNVKTLANDFGLSRSQLYRNINSITGHSPNSFIKEFRLRKAIELIRSQIGNISEISYLTGFNDPSYFSICFQKKFNISPSIYAQWVATNHLYQVQST